jgi:hypothetical protein
MQQTSSPAVRLKADAWKAWMERLGLYRVEEQAERIGVNRTHLYKIIAGTVAPGEQFIAACLLAYDGKFEDLFVAEAA